RAKELRAAGTAAENAVLLDEVQVARPGRLGGRQSEDRVAVGVELLPPLLVCLANLLHALQSRTGANRYTSVRLQPDTAVRAAQRFGKAVTGRRLLLHS